MHTSVRLLVSIVYYFGTVCLLRNYELLRFQVKVRVRTSRVEIENENTPRLRTASFRNRKGRKLSLVQELAQTYEFDECHLDSNVNNNESVSSQGEMMVILDGRHSTLRSHADVPDLTVSDGVLSSLTEMKGEVRREIEVMNMKMTQLEEQISTILSILKTQGHFHSQTCSPSNSMNRGRASSTSYLNDNSQPEDSPEHPSHKGGKLKQAQTTQGGSKMEKDDPLPDWLAPTESPKARSDSIPEWEDPSDEDPSVSAARLLNNKKRQEDKPETDPKILQTLSLMIKK